MCELADEILETMEPVCSLLDEREEGDPYSRALQQQRAKVADSSETPSAKLLAELKDQETSFFHYALHRSEHHRNRVLAGPPITEELESKLEREVERSHTAQRELEQNDTLSLEEFLAGYYRGG